VFGAGACGDHAANQQIWTVADFVVDGAEHVYGVIYDELLLLLPLSSALRLSPVDTPLDQILGCSSAVDDSVEHEVVASR